MNAKVHIMQDIEFITEAVTCPYCGHDAKFVHEPGQSMGFLQCDHCEDMVEFSEEDLALMSEVIW